MWGVFFFSRGMRCLWHSFLALLLPQSFSFECQWLSCPFCDCFVPSVIILSLQRSSSSSFEFAIHNYLLLQGYKQNCQVPALDLRFKGAKFPGYLYNKAFRFKIISIWKTSMPSANSLFQELQSFPHSSSFFHRITLHTATNQEIFI